MIKTKTNAMRILDAAKIEYEIKEYVPDENDLSGVHIAEQIGLRSEMVFKTLVAHGDKTGYIVFCIPSCLEIDLKKAASVTGNKKIEMVHVKDLLALTGYVRGACSPVGMKKKFPTFIDKSAETFDKITVSGGMKGAQLLLSPSVLIPFVDATLCEVTKND
ncbi:MAG: Cys-tRNA(Pro) deacylase [Ruminococcaceae bacterium]|nr:Cys-tRNA(Pro) deacylase [Oscillospiraceae bacterium]